MKAADLETMKEMSAELVDLLPDNLMMDGAGRFYRSGAPIEPGDVLTMCQATSEKAQELDAVIQSLEGRKSPTKDDGEETKV